MNSRNMKKSVLSVILVLALLATALCGIAVLSAKKAYAEGSGNVYYVEASQTIGTIGEAGNRNKPYNITTLLGSTSILKPGDTVKIIPGDYNLVNRIVIRASGAYNNYITIENESDTEQATLKFYGQLFGERGIEIYGDYIYWRDVDVCGAGDNGLYIGGSFNTVVDCEFYDNRDTGLQLGRSSGDLTTVEVWPSYNLIKNCTSHNNYDNETYGENADGFAAKLTVGYGNVFDGCIAYRNSDDGWDLYAKTESGNIGCVIMYNCVAFENGFLEYNQETCNAKFPNYRTSYNEAVTTNYDTRDGDGNGFKLGGSVMEGDVLLYNCLSFNNKMHGVTDNSNPGVISVYGVTSYDNARSVDNNVNSATYGQVLAKGGDACGNIDMSRQTYSYNNLDRVLSLTSAEAQNIDNDMYRASVQNSILGTASGNSKAYKIGSSLDADSKKGIKGVEIKAPAAKDVFETLPVDYATSTYNLSGLKDFDNGENRIHNKYRNADGSINMHGILAVKDYSKLLGENNKIGSVLNLTSYEAYEHFDLVNDYTGLASETDAILKAAKETLTISCNANAVYQNFWAATSMKGVTIEWTSSNNDVLEVSSQTKNASSQASFVQLIVNRHLVEDQQVVLTATIKAGGKSETKQFNLTVKQDEPRIGDIFVSDAEGNRIYDGGNIILKQFTIATEPQISVVNGANYSGLQFVLGSQFNVQTKYEYATDKNSNYVQVKEFTPSNAGVWHITHIITLNHSGETKSFHYYIYTPSTDALVEFVGTPSVSVNREGFLVSGELSNVSGTIYAFASPKEVNVTAENFLSFDNVEAHAFSSDTIICQFTNANNSGYYVYFVLANLRGNITSQVYQDRIGVVEISDAQAFMKVAGGKSVEGEQISKTIYSVTKCIDFANVSWSSGTDAFSGVLNGNGHTISNVKVNGAGLFNKVEGGTIINLKFDNIDIDNAENQKTGIVATVYGGYFHNIAITRVNVSGGQRVGGFIGQIYQGATATYISNVSLINPIPELNENGTVKETTEKTYTIRAKGNRAAGIVGFIQPSSSGITQDIVVYVKNCFTSSYITASGYSIGGIVGEFDDTYAASIEPLFKLEISNCYTTSVLVGTGSSSRIGGMLGYQHGGGYLNIAGCLSMSTAYYKDLRVDVAQKNISGIVGGFASVESHVSRCGALMEEYNSDYSVQVYDARSFEGNYGEGIISNTLGFDTSVWKFVKSDDGSKLQVPYIVLVFDGECSDAK